MLQLQRKNFWNLGVILLFLVFSVSFASGLKINEVMPHTNNFLGGEWVELYNNETSAVNLLNWKIGDKVGNDTINLTIEAESFAIIADSVINCENVSISCISLSTIGSGLNDAAETLNIYDDSSHLIDSFSWNKDLKSSGKSWQFCGDVWAEGLPTPLLPNICNINNLTNQTEYTNTSLSNNSQEAVKIDIQLDYPDEAEYNEEFSVTLEIHGIEGEYDVKIAVIDEDENIISRIYDENEDKWQSSNYYLDNAMEDDDEKDFDLKITKDYEGDAIIEVKIRQNNKAIAEEEFDIEIKDGEEDDEKDEEGQKNIINNSAITGFATNNENIIYLGGRQEGKEYKSKEQKIKEIMILLIPFIFLIVLAGVLIIMIKKRREKVL